jgi:uncharacterized protein
MAESVSYQEAGAAASGEVSADNPLFAQTMGYVAAAAAVFALGAYLGRNMTHNLGFVGFIAAFACLVGMRFAARRSPALAVALLLIFGVLMGLALAPVLAFYARANPRVLWETGGATALFIAGFGAAGYATRRDLSVLARVCFFALLGLFVAGIVLIYVHIPGAWMLYSLLGLAIFAGFTMVDFQRLRRAQGISSAPLLAASIFVDVLNVFQFFLKIFSSEERA